MIYTVTCTLATKLAVRVSTDQLYLSTEGADKACVNVGLTLDSYLRPSIFPHYILPVNSDSHDVSLS